MSRKLYFPPQLWTCRTEAELVQALVQALLQSVLTRDFPLPKA